MPVNFEQEILDALGVAEDEGAITSSEENELADALSALIRRDWAIRVLDAWAAQRDTYWFAVDDDITTYVRYPRCTGLGLGCGIGTNAARLAAANTVFRSLPGDVVAMIGECP